MCPKEARIFHAEDDPEWQECVSDAVSAKGHRVVATARTVREAEAVIPTLAERGVSVAILDDKLEDFGDGKRIAKKIKSVCPGIPIVSFSTFESFYADRYFEKRGVGKRGISGLVEYISNL